ncbi:MAG: glycerophosphodiester phosphodiesterase [Promethearchaeota archaeon]
MKRPYIFGHRGGMGLCIENTLPCFLKALKYNVGIETDVQLTRDDVLICFHDHVFKLNSKTYNVADLTYHELQQLEFPDNRKIPTAHDLFKLVLNEHKVRMSFDIRGKNAGKALITIAKQYGLLYNIEISDRRMIVLSQLRKFEDNVKLIYTLPDKISKINDVNVNFVKLHKLNVKSINLKSSKANIYNFNEIAKHGLECYVWGLNYKSRLKKIMQLRIGDKKVSAVYSDYPDLATSIRKEIEGSSNQITH